MADFARIRVIDTVAARSPERSLEELATCFNSAQSGHDQGVWKLRLSRQSLAYGMRDIGE